MRKSVVFLIPFMTAGFISSGASAQTTVRDHRGSGGAPQGGVTVSGGQPCGYRCGTPGHQPTTVVRPPPQHGQYWGDAGQRQLYPDNVRDHRQPH
jgi:hypothetical protein